MDGTAGNAFRRKADMSSPIVPTQSTTGTGSAIPPAPDDAKAAAARNASPASWTAQFESAVSEHGTAGSPPAEVLDQMAQAALTYERLTAQGRELRFVRDEVSGRGAFEVHDRDGSLLKRLSLDEACDIAAGAPLD
jgi:hypothetical protein